MTGLLTALVVGLAIPLIAFAGKQIFMRRIRGASKELIVNFEDGRTQVVAVSPDVDQRHVSDFVRRELDLQNRVFHALQAHADRVAGLEVRRGGHGEFILSQGDRSLAIVVKTRIGRTLLDEIERYRRGVLGARKLVLFMTGDVPPRLIRQIKSLDDPAAVELVQTGSIDEIDGALLRVMDEQFRRDAAPLAR